MCAAVIINTFNLALLGFQVYYGLGRHKDDLTAENYIQANKLYIPNQAMSTVGMCLCKISVGFTLLRIAAQRAWKWIIISIMVFVALYSIQALVVSVHQFWDDHCRDRRAELTCDLCQIILFQCADIRTTWDRSIVSKCWPVPVITGLAYFVFSMNIVTDLILAVLIPVPMLWSLNVNARTRNVLFGILSLGLIGCAAGFVRISYLHDYQNSTDFLWDSRFLADWTAIELNLGIIAGSLPAIKPLGKTFFGSITSKSGSKLPTSGSGHMPGHGYQGHALKGSRSDHWQASSSERRGRRSPTAHILDDSESERGLWTGTGAVVKPTDTDQYEMNGLVREVSPVPDVSVRAHNPAKPKVNWGH